MKLINVGAGSNRPQDEFWWNLDDLHRQLKPGTPERTNLDAEPRYVNHELLADGPMPFGDDSFDSILASHLIEHFSCHDAVLVLKDCRRILKPGGLLVVSVPDADYFRSVHHRDTPENAVELFGEPIHDKWQPDFMSYALLHRDHKQVLTSGSLRCLLLQAGFACISDISYVAGQYGWHYCAERELENLFQKILPVMNRRKFSLEICAIKSSAP
jgi:SAM-dependent methyltransferase